jgi:hypothetical protein
VSTDTIVQSTRRPISGVIPLGPVYRQVPSMDEPGFARLASHAQKSGPVSNVLNTAIALDAKSIGASW